MDGLSTALGMWRRSEVMILVEHAAVLGQISRVSFKVEVGREENGGERFDVALAGWVKERGSNQMQDAGWQDCMRLATAETPVTGAWHSDPRSRENG